MSDDFEQATPAPARRKAVGAADTMRADRLPPNSPDAEAGVLGCCLLAPEDALPVVIEKLGLDGMAFYTLAHRELWFALVALSDEGKAIDLMTVQQRLRDTGKLDEVGGLAALSALCDGVPSAANVGYYTDIVADKWLLRRMERECVAMLQHVHSCTNAMELANRFSAAAMDLAVQDAKAAAKPVHEEFRGVIAELESFRQGRKQMKGFATGLNFLDNMLCGLKPAEYIIIAAGPGGGKTALALQIADHVAAVEGAPVGMFSLEMNRMQLASRLVFQRAGVNFQAYRNGFLRETDAALLTKACNAMKRIPLHVDDSSGLNIDELSIRARRMVREQGVKLFVIDYLQLMGGRSGVNYRDLNMRISDVSDGLMKLKKELNVPFIVLAQENFNQERAEREREPQLSDLKDSAKPTADADVVAFLKKVDLTRAKRDIASDDEVKRAIAERKLEWMQSRAVGSLPAELRDDLEKHCQRRDLFVVKQRNGPTGPVELVFVKPWMRFIDAHVDSDEGPMALPA
jgi:replicative DNA helicase